jgi:hypothetical protein
MAERSSRRLSVSGQLPREFWRTLTGPRAVKADLEPTMNLSFAREFLTTNDTNLTN